MGGTKRVTIYFAAELHRALRLWAAASDQSVSGLVNDAVRLTLAEDLEGLEAFKQRAGEPSLSFESFVRSLRRCGKI